MDPTPTPTRTRRTARKPDPVKTGPRRAQEPVRSRPGIERPFVVEDVPIEALRPDPGNPRQMSTPKRDALDRSVEEFGIVQAVVTTLDLDIIAGHQRVDVARRHGLATVPVIRLDVTPEQAQVLGLGLNQIGGTFDEGLLARRLAMLDAAPGVDLAVAGFDETDVRRFLRTLETRERRWRPESFDLEAALAGAMRRGRAEPGSLWILGDHRVLCGDATRPSDLERVLGGRKAAEAFADPPYGVGLGDHGGRTPGSRRRRIANDALSPEAFEAFCRGWAAALLGAVDGAIYVCMSSRAWPTVARILEEQGAHWSDTIVWAKDRLIPGMADYQHEYELLWYGWRAGVVHYWCGDRDQSDVWRIRRPGASPLHPTTKPVELVVRAISNSSRPGELVLDPFGGSGTTLIACERTGRTAAIVELEPTYVDVILARWEAFTGQTAVPAGR